MDADEVLTATAAGCYAVVALVLAGVLVPLQHRARHFRGARCAGSLPVARS